MSENIGISWDTPIIMNPFKLSMDKIQAVHPNALMETPVENHYTHDGITLIPIWQTTVSEKGNIYFDADLKVIISKDNLNKTCNVKYNFYIIRSKYHDKISSADDLYSCHTLFSSKSYDYNNSTETGPFSFRYGNSNVPLSSLKPNGYINESDEITIICMIKSVNYFVPKSEIALKIFQYFSPELFADQIENRKKYYKMLLDQNIEYNKKQKELELELERKNKEILENVEFNEINIENSRINQELDKIQMMMRSDDERANELKLRLENNNFNRLLMNIDNMSQREIIDELNKLSQDELAEIAIKLVKLKHQTMVERIDGDLCSLCFTNERNTIITPCNHRFFCNDCTSIFVSNHKLCPMCCQPYLNILNIIP
ncbi:MAG: RING-HC finger protein [Candidatus Paceibacterota bacterium]